MIIYSGILLLILSFAIAFFSNLYAGSAKREISRKLHWGICAAAALAGCVIRFYELGALLEGVNAEEALSAVQAKSLWQTGSFLFHGNLTTQFEQWSGETGGPFLAFVAAPFVGVMGMNALAVRLPLTLLSCVAMFAAYGIGKEVSGDKAGRWMMMIYALCPVFILSARFAASANAAIFLMPIAFYALIRGMRTTAFLYAGMLLVGLLTYTYDIYFFIVPFVILAAAVYARRAGIKRNHCVAACLAGMLVYVPAFLTLLVNLCGLDGFALFGLIEIPRLEGFAKGDFLWTGVENAVRLAEAFRDQLVSIGFGCIFQEMRHENISSALFSPSEVPAFYMFSVPVLLLGALAVLCACVERKNETGETALKRNYLLTCGVVALTAVILVGNRGFADVTGGTNVYDYGALFMFMALMMSMGLCRIERKSVIGGCGMLGVFAASFAVFCMFMFGGAYQEDANTHFVGLDNLCRKAAQLQDTTGNKVYITTTVYPHMNPSDAAEIMYLYASDADLKMMDEKRGNTYEVAYLSGVERLEPEAIYIANVRDLYNCELENWVYEEEGEYVLLTYDSVF